MKTNRRGLTTVGTVVAIVVGVLVIGVAVYFISAPFRSKVKESYDQFSKWTPENIAKDPKGYLNFCEEQTKTALNKCAASKIAINQKLAQYEDKQQDAEKVVEGGRKGLDELKEAYRKAETDKKWPLTWSGATLDQEAAKRRILRFSTEVDSKTAAIAQYKQLVTQLRTQLNKVEAAKDQAQMQLTKIDESREKITVQQISDDLKNNLVSMKGAIQSTITDIGVETGGPASLEELAAQHETKADDAKFDEIMKKK